MPPNWSVIQHGSFHEQVLFSRLWLERFRFGPLEWLWRMLTYGEWLPLAKRAAV
jgi:uncharacterized protein